MIDEWGNRGSRCFGARIDTGKHLPSKAATDIQEMQRPLQLTFKGMKSSPALEALVRERVNRLERLYPRLVGCRVVVEVPHRGSGTAKTPLAVSVEAEVPGHGIAVGRDKVDRREAKQDHTAALNNAFEAVERQLIRIEDARSHEALAHATDGQSGMITRLFAEQGYGFIEIGSAPELYFTRNAIVGADFDQLEIGTMVQVTRTTDEGPMGPQASAVRLLDRKRAPP